MKIDLKRDRKLLGLPSNSAGIIKALKVLAGAALAVILAYVGGATLGSWRNQLNAMRMEKILKQIQTLDYRMLTEKEFQGLTREVQMQAQKTGHSAILLAVFYLMAAENRPSQEMWLQAAKFQLLTMPDKKESDNVYFKDKIASVDNTLGNYKEALELFNSIKPEEGIKVFGEDNYYNTKAYFLACTAKGNSGYAAEALKIMKTKVLNKPQNWLVGAYLDTLAEAYFALGDYDKALGIQKRALALTDSSLWITLEHYRKYQQKTLSE